MKILGIAHGNKNDLHFKIELKNIGTFRGVLFFESTYACITNFKPKKNNFDANKVLLLIKDFLEEKDFTLFTQKIFKQRTRGGEKRFRYFLMKEYTFLVLGE